MFDKKITKMLKLKRLLTERL